MSAQRTAGVYHLPRNDDKKEDAMEMDCKDCSGLKANISNLQASDKAQWMKIDSMINKINVILGGVIVSMLGIAAMLLMELAKKP